MPSNTTTSQPPARSVVTLRRWTRGQGANPIVSVVIPAYNAQGTIGRTLGSLIAQTLTEWEAIVVDDGSTDHTWREIECWMRRDARIRGIRLSRNVKTPLARNHAIAATSGKWIAVLDADDWILPNRLAELVVRGESIRADVITDNQVLFDAQAGCAVGTALPITPGVHLLSLDDYLASCIPGVSRFDHGMLKPVVRRSFLVRTGVRYEPGCQHGEDFHFMLDLLAAGARALVVHEPFYIYVQPFGALSRQASHSGRLPYRYDLMRRYTDRAIACYQTRLGMASLRNLQRRSRAIDRYAAYVAMKDALANGMLLQAFAELFRNPACLQPACVAVLARLGVVRRIFPLPEGHPEIVARSGP
jgi:glycosyltransferase involved in cell wall biosynthesis